MSASASASTSTNAPSSSSNRNNNVSPTLPSDPSPETRRQIAEARTALEASMNNIGSTLDTQLRSRAQNLHANSTQLEKQQKDLVKATEGLRKETDKLKKVANEGAKRLKELGSVQNWAEMLERDFVVLEETLRLAAKGSESEGSWEEGSGSDSEGSITDDEERLRGIGIFGRRMGDWVDDGDGSSVGDENRGVDGDGDTNMGDIDLGEIKPPYAEEPSVGGAASADGPPYEDVVKMADMGEEQGIPIPDKGKAKENDMELETQSAATQECAEAMAGSSTATATNGSGSDPSSGSIHTAASVTS